MQNIDCEALLNEVLTVCPGPVRELMKHLTASLSPGRTQTRYMEIGPMKWWVKNMNRCPIVYDLLFNSPIHTYYALSAVSLRVTHMPIYSKATNRHNLRFMELRYQLNLITTHVLTNQVPYMQCKHFSKDSWAENQGLQGQSGRLVSDLNCKRIFIRRVFRSNKESSADSLRLTIALRQNQCKSLG